MGGLKTLRTPAQFIPKSEVIIAENAEKDKL
jgi:hypothetical protein